MKRAITVVVLVMMTAASAWAVEGSAVFNQKCKPCHSIAGAGGPMAKLGGPLDEVGKTHDEAWLRAYLANPKSKVPNSKMPKVTLSDEEMNGIVTYLLTMKGAPAPASK